MAKGENWSCSLSILSPIVCKLQGSEENAVKQSPVLSAGVFAMWTGSAE